MKIIWISPWWREDFNAGLRLDQTNEFWLILSMVVFTHWTLGSAHTWRPFWRLKLQRREKINISAIKSVRMNMHGLFYYYWQKNNIGVDNVHDSRVSTLLLCYFIPCNKIYRDSMCLITETAQTRSIFIYVKT